MFYIIKNLHVNDIKYNTNSVNHNTYFRANFELGLLWVLVTHIQVKAIVALIVKVVVMAFHLACYLNTQCLILK